MRSADCHEPGGGRADVGIGPYEKTGSGSVGGCLKMIWKNQLRQPLFLRQN